VEVATGWMGVEAEEGTDIVEVGRALTGRDDVMFG
jgi:hypothetical protein